MTRKIALTLLPLLVLAACSTQRGGGYYQNDGPPKRPRVDSSAIADPVPRAEPQSPYGNDPYIALGKTYYPLSEASGYRERGIASWYGKKFHGRRTSSGERYDMYTMTAAHKTLPLPTYVRVKNLRNGRAAIVRVNDRGPFLHNRLIDLSYAAAVKLDIVKAGTGLVEVEALDPLGQSTVSNRNSIATTSAVEFSAVDGKRPRLYLQMGAFTNRENAVGLRSRLQDADFGPVLIQSEVRDNVRFYRVRVGPIASVEESDRLVRRAIKYGVSDAHIVIE